MQLFKLATVKRKDIHEPCICISDSVYPLRLLPDLPPSLQKATFKDLLESWHESFCLLGSLAERIVSNLEEFSPYAMPSATIEYETPVRFPNKLLCVGANYAGHLLEMGLST